MSKGEDLIEDDEVHVANPLPNIGALWLSEDGREVLNTRIFTKEML